MLKYQKGYIFNGHTFVVNKEDVHNATDDMFVEATALLPVSDVAPVRHGRWDDSGRYRFENGDLAIRCAGCGCSLREEEFEKFVWNYCPVCGAKMDLKGDCEDA